MAMWQYRFNAVLHSNKRISGLSEASLISVEKIMPKEKSWTDRILQYGNLDSDCIEIFYDDSSIDSIEIRIDLRNSNKNIVNAIIEFMLQNDLVILDGKDFLTPSFENIRKLIKQSEEYKFVINPREFLDRLHKERLEK